MRSSGWLFCFGLTIVFTLTDAQAPSMCPDLDRPLNGETYGECKNAYPGSWCSFSCNAGFDLKGSNAIYCMPNSQWHDDVPVCKGTCPDLNGVKNGDMFGDCKQVSKENSKCAFLCHKGFRRIGPSTIHCLLYGWSSKPPTCVDENCPTELADMCWREDAICVKTPKDSYTCNCIDENKIWNALQRRCQNATINLSCPDLEKPDHGSMHGKCWNANQGDSCDFNCYGGLMLNGSRSIYCTKDGQWNQDPPTCVGINLSCPGLEKPDHGSMHGKCWNANPGDWCDFNCYGGLMLNGSKSIYCTKDGQWNQDPPTCVDFNKGCPVKMEETCRNGGAICVLNSEGSFTCNCTEDDQNWSHTFQNCTGAQPDTCTYEKWYECYYGNATCWPDRWGGTCRCNNKRHQWDHLEKTCTDPSGRSCNDLKEGSWETWHSFCARMENSICSDSVSGGTPRCVCKPGCRVGSPGNCVCNRILTVLLRGNLTLNVQGQIEIPDGFELQLSP